MKKSHIIGIIAIAVAIGIIVGTAGDASSYVTFRKAADMAKNGNTEQIHVVGKVPKDAKGHMQGLVYQPQIDPNRFEFTLIDTDNRVQKCVYNSPKPQDFGAAEQVVVVGAMTGDHFQADKILLKCPSKYQDGKLEVTEHQAQRGPAIRGPAKTAKL